MIFSTFAAFFAFSSLRARLVLTLFIQSIFFYVLATMIFSTFFQLELWSSLKSGIWFKKGAKQNNKLSKISWNHNNISAIAVFFALCSCRARLVLALLEARAVPTSKEWCKRNVVPFTRHHWKLWAVVSSMFRFLLRLRIFIKLPIIHLHFVLRVPIIVAFSRCRWSSSFDHSGRSWSRRWNS